jgi:hypothetical protein
MKYQVSIRSNEGYGSSQISRGISVAELRDALYDLDDDDEIITYDLNNPRGAAYGKLTLDIDPCLEDEEE